MKLLPRSIVGRTTWVLSAGFIVVIIGSVFISSLIIRSESNTGNMIEVATKVIVMTSILKNMNKKNRITVIDSFQDINIKIHQGSNLIPQVDVTKTWRNSRIQAHLDQHMEKLGLHNVLLSHPELPESGLPNNSKIIVSVIYEDGDKIQFEVKSPHRHVDVITNVLLVVVFIITCIYILSFVITRQIIKPINYFSNASSRFSTDIDAPALDEFGPVEIRNAAIAFNTMQQRIRRFVSERMQIIAAISHDLRTPLTRLRLRVESVGDEQLQKKLLRDITEMQSMMDSTLSFARDDAAVEEKTTVDLATLIKSICDDEADAGNQVQYSGPEHHNYYCRPTAMRRVMNNIIGNSIKYAGAAQVSLVINENSILIEIVDNGPGIADAQLENVFAPFYRIEASRNNETGGTGLGLTVARTIVRAHGGEITLTNTTKADAGLCVNITLSVL